MRKPVNLFDRGEVTSFSRNSYEVVFSVFMIALAYFYRDSPLIVYPRILYFFLLLLASNFAFNRLLRERNSVSLWLLDTILLANFWIITGVLYCSGGGMSSFWVLYLLPVFGASLMASLKDAYGIVLLCALALAVFSWPLSTADIAGLLAYFVKLAVLAFSAGIVYSTAQSKKRVEAGLAFKRGQVDQLEKKLTETNLDLVKSASAGEVGTLVSGVLHDIGNSITVILLSAQILSADDESGNKDLARILKAARFAKGMLSNALSIVRGQEYAFEPVLLSDAAETAALLTGYAALKKGVALEVDVHAGLPPLRASRVHIERLMINAVINAISFVPKESGKVTLAARPADGGVLLEVTDNGPGFPEKMINDGVKAFGTTRKEAGGTGLGLFVCDQIAARHGGRMTISNIPGGGAKVVFFLPLAGPKQEF